MDSILFFLLFIIECNNTLLPVFVPIIHLFAVISAESSIIFFSYLQSEKIINFNFNNLFSLTKNVRTGTILAGSIG
jgi:hypothetical protein